MNVDIIYTYHTKDYNVYYIQNVHDTTCFVNIYISFKILDIILLIGVSLNVCEYTGIKIYLYCLLFFF